MECSFLAIFLAAKVEFYIYPTQSAYLANGRIKSLARLESQKNNGNVHVSDHPPLFGSTTARFAP